jgi:hypothetical protein
MTILRQLLRAFKPSARYDVGFENYYARLARSGDQGIPTASEARQDLRAARSQAMTYRYL